MFHGGCQRPLTQHLDPPIGQYIWQQNLNQSDPRTIIISYVKAFNATFCILHTGQSLRSRPQDGLDQTDGRTIQEEGQEHQVLGHLGERRGPGKATKAEGQGFHIGSKDEAPWERGVVQSATGVFAHGGRGA